MFDNRLCTFKRVRSVTRFGEILQLGSILKVLRLLFMFFSICPIFPHTLAIFYDVEQIFVVVNGQILEHNLAIKSL